MVVGKAAFENIAFAEVNSTNTAFNLYFPDLGLQHVITGIRLKANRDVSNTTDASVVVYEASSLTSTIEDKVLYETALVRGEFDAMPPGVELLVNEGKFINVKTTDASIFANVFTYLIQRVTR